MSDQEDPELQALQRQLDDAFHNTRPRAGFEDDLWSSMQARRPVWAQARDFFGGLLAAVPRVPPAPGAALAARPLPPDGGGDSFLLRVPPRRGPRAPPPP